MQLSDENNEQFQELVNATMRELAFLGHHADDNEMEQACDVMLQIRLNVEALEEIIDESCPKIAEEKLCGEAVEAAPREPVCPKCNDRGVICYGVGQTLDCECRESPVKKINDEKGAAE